MTLPALQDCIVRTCRKGDFECVTRLREVAPHSGASGVTVVSVTGPGPMAAAAASDSAAVVLDRVLTGGAATGRHSGATSLSSAARISPPGMPPAEREKATAEVPATASVAGALPCSAPGSGCSSPSGSACSASFFPCLNNSSSNSASTSSAAQRCARACPLSAPLRCATPRRTSSQAQRPATTLSPTATSCR